MGKLMWNDLSRFISISASTYAVWACFWGMFYRKFFWDFIGGILRNPGGLQPSPKVHMFISIIVKLPIVQTVAMVIAFIILALEYPLPIFKGSALQRSAPLKIVLLFLQAFLTVLLYQGTNASLWSLIAVVGYITSLARGERIEAPKADKGRSTQA